MTTKQKINIDNLISVYYKYKGQYLNSVDAANAAYNSAVAAALKKNPSGSLAGIVKKQPKCLYCGREVGMKFGVKMSDDHNRVLFGLCGDDVKPCQFNITIDMGRSANIYDELEMYKKDIKKIEDQIIIDKNRALFGYMSEDNAVKKFKELAEMLADLNEDYEYLNAELNAVINNPDKTAKLRDARLNQYNHIEEIKNLVKTYKENPDAGYHTLEEAAEINKNQIRPIVKLMLGEPKKHIGIKYAVNQVESTTDPTLFTLMQYNYTNEQMQFSYKDRSVPGNTVANITFGETVKTGAEKVKSKPKPKSSNLKSFIPEKPVVPEPVVTEVEISPETLSLASDSDAETLPLSEVVAPPLNPFDEFVVENETGTVADPFDFATYPEDKAIFDKYFTKIELYLRLAIWINYKYDYIQTAKDRADLMAEYAAKSADGAVAAKEFLVKLTDAFDTTALLTQWYQHFAPAKVADVDTHLQTYINCEGQLFNKLYKKYVDQSFDQSQFQQLWFEDPEECAKRPKK